jgi:ribosomal protein L11 methyltransferase
VLLAEMGLYAAQLVPGGHLLLRGFYTHDVADLKKAAASVGMQELHRDERETWAALLLQKDTSS